MSISEFTIVITLLCTLQDCDELMVDGGTVCYTRGRYVWRANIACLKGYDLLGTASPACYLDRQWTWTWNYRNTTCVQEQDSTTAQIQGLLGVYITIPIVIIVVIIIIVVVVFFYRKRRLTGNVRSKPQNDRTSAVTNAAYSDNVADRHKNTTQPETDRSDSEYIEIADSSDQNTSGYVIDTCNTDENVYNKLHEVDGRGYKSPSYINQSQVVSNTYDHTTNAVEGESETYSNLHDNTYNKNRPQLTNTSNIYDGLQVDVRCKMREFKGGDPYYDHTGACSEIPAGIELDTYAHVNNALGINDCDYTNTEESHKYFVLEKAQ